MKYMSRRNNVANRPSQANQEYVLNSKGEKVKNIAYKGNNKNKKDKAYSDATSDFSHNEEHNEFDVQLAVDNIIDSIDDFIIITNQRPDLFGDIYTTQTKEFNKLSQGLLYEKNNQIEKLQNRTLGLPEGVDIWQYEGEKYFDMKYETMVNSQEYKDNVKNIEQEYNDKYNELLNNHSYGKALRERKEIIEGFQEQWREHYDQSLFTNSDFMKELNNIYDIDSKYANNNGVIKNENKNRKLAAITLVKCLKEEEGIDTSMWIQKGWNGNKAVGFGVDITGDDSISDKTIEKLEKLDVYSKASAQSQGIEDYYRSRIYFPNENMSCELVCDDGEYYIKGVEIEYGAKAIAEPREATRSDNIVDTMRNFMRYKEENEYCKVASYSDYQW